MRNCKLRKPKWSIILPLISYLIFILIILTLSFPLNTPEKETADSNTIVESYRIEADDTENVDKNNVLIINSEPQTVILSNEHNDGTIILKKAFKRADRNHDGALSMKETAKYINYKIRNHIEHSVKYNAKNFAKIDILPKDGLISWPEYHTFFLRERGLDEEYIMKHNEKKHIKLDRRSKETIMKDKAMWSEAARTDSFSLNLEEFLAFQHPESSNANLQSLVDDILREFDLDSDDYLTADEFSNVLPHDLGETTSKGFTVFQDMDERREEFNKILDTNKDGKADRTELLLYVDPRHPRYSFQETLTLFSLADKNKDNKLTLEEMQKESKIFMTSKMISTSENFHDDF